MDKTVLFYAIQYSFNKINDKYALFMIECESVNNCFCITYVL